jgi:hypothetical protein
VAVPRRLAPTAMASKPTPTPTAISLIAHSHHIRITGSSVSVLVRAVLF